MTDHAQESRTHRRDQAADESEHVCALGRECGPARSDQELSERGRRIRANGDERTARSQVCLKLSRETLARAHVVLARSRCRLDRAEAAIEASAGRAAREQIEIDREMARSSRAARGTRRDHERH